MNIGNKIAELSATVEEWGRASALFTNLYSRKLSEASDYAMFSGGKRIRPVLALLVAEMLEAESSLLRNFVLALELIHTSSLIHDDLPGLDNDDLRRGKPTCHKVYGEGTAIITGDFLIAKAFELAASAPGVLPEGRAAWALLLSEATMALCDGQILDLEYSSGIGSAHFAALSGEEKAEAVLRCHRKKTGALFRAAVLGPVEILPWGKSEGIKESLSTLGEEMGMLFQLTDDLLDAAAGEEGDSNDTGFSVVSALGRGRAEEMVQETLARLETLLLPFGPRAIFLREFFKALGRRTS